jgi:hypothetical protein
MSRTGSIAEGRIWKAGERRPVCIPTRSTTTASFKPSPTVTSSRDGKTYSGQIVGRNPFTNPLGFTEISSQLIPVISIRDAGKHRMPPDGIYESMRCCFFDLRTADRIRAISSIESKGSRI